ncbi:hypothetical protein J6590_058636 [Homalodisca vitripennis]|nr:hypothetical protein J6590_093999 [Homalodisca vitripennis]KAG8335854.1 hypothetical protein J6590_058636 [Homalodisca vitripennis]
MLDDIYTQMRSEIGADVCKGMAVFDVIEELGGPPHVGLQLDYKLIEEKYKWNDSNETEDIKTILKDTRELWVAMEERANRLRHGIPDPDTEEDNKPPGVSSDSSEERLKDPTNQGSELLEGFQEYIGELYDVYEKVSTRDGELIKKGIEEFDIADKSGTALHFKMNVNFDLLKEKYYWSYDDRVLHARDLLNETEILWNKVAERIDFIRF